MLITISMLFTGSMSFAYWASSIAGNNNQSSGGIQIGHFPFGDPISTVQEFITLITTDEITGFYYLANDIDFENIQPAEWVNTDEIRFKAQLDGNGKTLRNIELNARRGIFGVLDGGIIKNLNIDGASITYTTAGSTTAGVLIGRIQGDGALVDNVNITNASVTSSVLSGAIAGLIQPGAGDPSGTATIRNVNVSTTTVSGALSNADYGNGGLVGSVNNFTVIIENSSASTTVSSTGASNAGGLIGAVLGSSVISILESAVTNSNISISGTGTTLGAAGVVGKLQNTLHTFDQITVDNVTVSSASSSAGVIGFATQSGGSATLSDIEVFNSTISSTNTSDTLGSGGIIGTMSTYIFDISNVSTIDTSITTQASNAGGVVGHVVGTSTLTLAGANINGSSMTINGSGTGLGAAGVVGKLQSTGHALSNIRVDNISVSSASASGGVVGFATQTSGSATINNAKIINSNIDSTFSGNTLGTGGIIGNTLSYTWTLNDLYVESSITTNNANVGGILGYVTGNVTVNRAVVFSDVILNNPSNTTDRGAGGLVGRNAGTMTATDVFFTGYLKARDRSSQPYIGTLRAIGTNVTVTNSRSAEIRYFLTSNSNTLVNTATLYNNMRGQKAAYASTYTILRSSLNAAYWTSNYTNITSSSLWAYNTTTNLYELID